MTAQVSRPCLRVVPASLCPLPGRLHTLLLRYKDLAGPVAREAYSRLVGALAARFLFDHRHCLGSGRDPQWDAIVTVPSTHHMPPGAASGPLAACLEKVPWLHAQHRDVLRRADGPLGRNRASDGAFALSGSVAGLKVVLLDDIYTSGAHAQSAASALSLAGATVVAIVTLGRVVRPEWTSAHRGAWEARLASPFSFRTCCLERARDDPRSRRAEHGRLADPNLSRRTEAREPDEKGFTSHVSQPERQRRPGVGA